MNDKHIKEVEMKNDGKDSERFKQLLKTVVSVPKDELKKRRRLVNPSSFDLVFSVAG